MVTAVRRDTWSTNDALMPEAPAPETLARTIRPNQQVAWLQRYEVRPISGGIPSRWDGQGEHSLGQL